ncbi:MAG: DUF58 domain-containing protein [Brumimicrobium sp.]
MFKSFYISQVWFIVFAIGITLMVLGYYVPFLLFVGQFVMITLVFLSILDLFILFLPKNPIEIQRKLSERLNLGDESEVEIWVQNESHQPFYILIYDEPPVELQARNLAFQGFLKKNESLSYKYKFVPTKRGVYQWKDFHVFLHSFFRLLERRIIVPFSQEVSVYPSVLQMKKLEFLMFNKQTQIGIKRIRRIGHNNEFEQIKDYVQGDVIRSINWKATSRTSSLMVNQYQEQKSQPVYVIIDKSRSMNHEFNKLTLLDYAINSALVFSNIALRKGDKMGLITFSHKIGTQIAPNTGNKQLHYILESLYAQKTEFKEANYPLLYLTLRKQVNTRSLLMLYTNFETVLAMRRALPILKKLNKNHVLVVVFFKNMELTQQIHNSPDTIHDLYVSTIAEEIMNLKKKIALELKQHGIQSILTEPDDLNISTVNKYLELKSKGLI